MLVMAGGTVGYTVHTSTYFLASYAPGKKTTKK